ncbi:MAG TPA: HAMP domain-containing sensor histidine kinase [Methylomirabilota bacterium]|nr:HAMP domain-containing sensor histidine kinase [Methylomirabilota bacterium]
MTFALRSPAARFSALALVAVVAPATIVAVLGWVSLRQWQRSSELLFREQARDVASMAAEKVEMVLRMSEDAFLDRLQAVLSTGRWTAGEVDALVASAPLVRRLYLVDGRGVLLYPVAPIDEDGVVLARLRAEAAKGGWERGGKRELLAGDQTVMALMLPGGAGSAVLVALSRDVNALRRDVFEAALGGLESPTILAVLDHEGRPVYSRAPLADAERLLSVTFREGLPRWRVAVYQAPGASPRQAVRRQVMLFMIAFGVLLAVIVAGLVVTWRLMRHETEMARLKSDFVANVSHDLKTPLSVIRMFGETLEMGRVPDEARRHEYYRVITRESERLSRLIDNVLDFSRIEGGRRRYDLAPTPVEPLVRETLDAFAYPLAQQGFKVEVHVTPDLPEVEMDADAIGQALANLVDNAIKYSRDEDRSLTVDARAADGRLLLSVSDHGLGIPAAEQPRIFEKFYRVGRSETQGRRGSGVGLALVRHVAEAHGGGVTVESAPGRGSRFTLWIPLHA